MSNKTKEKQFIVVEDDGCCEIYDESDLKDRIAKDDEAYFINCNIYELGLEYTIKQSLTTKED